MDKVIVSKFGGTSMADSGAMIRSATIVKEQQSNLAVVSAISGTTDNLLKLITLSLTGSFNECLTLIFLMKEKHFIIANELEATETDKNQLTQYFIEIETLAKGINLLKECTPKAKDQLLSFGELLSSVLFLSAVKKLNPNKNVKWLDVRDILITDSQFSKATPLFDVIEKNAKKLIINKNTVYVTQGFIGKTESGLTTVLGRGGSDYSASILGEAINADVIEIWTDVEGVASTDPRICLNAQMISEISYNEASEMAVYGAKVLHPTTLTPAMRKNIPVFVGSSLNKNAQGTWIKNSVEFAPTIRAITKRSKQAILTIQNPNMLDAYGFMGKIFEVFSKHRVSVDCVTTSEISVAITIDIETLNNDNFLKDMEAIGKISLEKGYSLISIIGNDLFNKMGVAKNVFNVIDETNIRMMSFGASAYNFNFLVKDTMADDCIKNLHAHLIEKKKNNENISNRV